MRSDRTPPPLRRRIVAVSLASSALLFLLAGGLTAALLRSFQAEDAREMLEKVSADIAAAYADCAGDAERMREIADDLVDTYGTDEIALLLSAPDGDVLLRTGAADALPGAPRGAVPAATAGAGRRAMRVRETALPDGARLAVGLDETRENRRFGRLVGAMSVAFLVALLIGGFSADWLARRFVRSLGGVSAAAARIRAGEWSARVEPTRESLEIARLEDAFNTMCDRNERTLEELRTLTDDIAHDLRTPLTRLRAAAEFVAMGGAPKTPLPDMLFEQSGEMLELVNTLLDISRAGSGLDGTPREEIDLVSFLQRTAALYETVLADRRIRLGLSLPPEPLPFPGHRDRLQRLVGNLLDNAIKFTPEGGSVSLALDRSGGNVVLRVSDTGCGIASGDLPHVFRRFWRADASRSLPGNGLGLALVKAIVSSYGGDVRCESEPGRGTCFTVELPVPDAAPGPRPAGKGAA